MNGNKKVLVIGDLPLATRVFRCLYSMEGVTVSAVYTQYKDKIFNNDPWEDNTSLYEEAIKYNFPIFHNQDDVIGYYPVNFFDLGISCRASVIYKPAFIKLFKKYLINMHGGILPQRAGLHISSHCIIDGDIVSGGTLHLINEKIDDGDIISRNEFSIDSSDTSLDVYKKTQIALFDLFIENINNILDDKIETISQKKLITDGVIKKYYNKYEIFKRKEIDIYNITKEKLDRTVRGLDFPGHEPAYIVLNNNKIYLTTRRFFENEK